MSKQLNARLCVIEGCSRKVQRAARICCYCRKQYSRDHTPYKFKSGLVSGRLLKPYNTVTPATKRYRLRQIDNDLAWFGGSDAGFDQLLLDFQKRHPVKGCELSEEQDMHIIAGRNIIDYCRHSCYRSHERKQIERIIVRVSENLDNQELLEHQKLKDTQRSFFKYTRDNLKPWMILLVMDFTQLPTFGTNAAGFNDLVFCYYTRDPNTNQIIKKNIDIIAKHEHNWIFVRQAFRTLQQIGLFDNYSHINCSCIAGGPKQCIPFL